ncbi:MAG TPA: amidohydrolase family protein [Mycobacteriales bacterium]|nr:amidohydrolase family protein [Mycobacteriales bacterium]
MTVLLRAVEVDGAVVDCRLGDGLIAEVGRDLAVRPGDEVVDGRGGALIAGLADHHLHLLAIAARAGSIDVGLSLEPLRSAPGDGWIRAVGAVRELTRGDLDAVAAHRPVRVQHVGGSLWTLNTAALDRLGITGAERETGQLWRADARLRALLADDPADDLVDDAVPDVARVGAELAARGVTHCTDATPDLDEDAVALITKAVPQHVLALGSARGSGPRKLVVGDHELPDPDALAAAIAMTHDAGRAVALHVVTRAALVIAVAALRAAGGRAGDRIEHAAVCDEEQAGELAELGVIVVTQPGLLAAHGDRYLRDVDADDRRWLWRCAGLERAGVRVALSSDAPYGPLDPWATLRAARDRTTATGVLVGADERVTAASALRMMQTELDDPTGAPRAVAAGQPADVVLLHTSLRDALDALDATAVRHTFIAGRAVTPSGR